MDIFKGFWAHGGLRHATVLQQCRWGVCCNSVAGFKRCCGSVSGSLLRGIIGAFSSSRCSLVRSCCGAWGRFAAEFFSSVWESLLRPISQPIEQARWGTCWVTQADCLNSPLGSFPGYCCDLVATLWRASRRLFQAARSCVAGSLVSAVAAFLQARCRLELDARCRQLCSHISVTFSADNTVTLSRNGGGSSPLKLNSIK